MALRYCVYAQSLSQPQFEELLRDLKGSAFLANEIADSAQSIDVILENRTMDEFITAFPLLNKCQIIQLSK